MTSEKFRNKYRSDTIRLKNWDYSSNGYYFITICTKDRWPYFGEIKSGGIEASGIGKIADQCWRDIPSHFPFVVLDQYVIMPNHVHGILVIDNNNRENGDGCFVEAQNFAPLQGASKSPQTNKFGPQSKNLASVIRGFKIGVKKWATINNIDFAWQPRFYEHIIRDNQSLNRIRNYIVNNPLNWEKDRNNKEELYI